MLFRSSEDELLRHFLDDISEGYDYPDIITGWNVQFYDIPYLINRMKTMFAEENWMRLSPFERISDRRVTLNGRDQTVMDVKGLAILDYYELYRKFTYTQQESYRLDHIAHVELGKRKLSYAEFKSIGALTSGEFPVAEAEKTEPGSLRHLAKLRTKIANRLSAHGKTAKP